MVPSPPFVAIPSFSRRAHWLSCYAHGGFSCPWMWRSGEVDHMEQIKRGNSAFRQGRRLLPLWLLSQNSLADACQWMCCSIPCQLVS